MEAAGARGKARRRLEQKKKWGVVGGCGEAGVKRSQDSERKQATAASFCSCFNGTERSCLLPLARVVPHHSTYKSGLVIKLYHQAPPNPPTCPLFPFLLPPFSLSARLACHLLSLSLSPSCQVRQHAQAKRELRGTIWAETKKKEEQIKAWGMRMERTRGLLLSFSVRTLFRRPHR